MPHILGENLPFKTIRGHESLNVVTPQPEFPRVDLTDSNAHVLAYILSEADHGSEVQASSLESSQREVHVIATNALRILGLAPHYTEDEYRAFTQGFATMEAMADIVRSQDGEGERTFQAAVYDTVTATRRTSELLVNNPEDVIEIAGGRLRIVSSMHDAETQARGVHPLADLHLSEMYATWPTERPNTHQVIVDTAPTSYASLHEVRARIMGARIAFQLQLPSQTAA